MQKRKQLQYAVVCVLGFALLFMTVGFAAYAQYVSNDSVSAIQEKAVHKIGFDAESYLESESSVSPSVKTITNDEISFSIHLNQGETYASVINIVNNGNVNEKLTQLKMTELSPELASKVDFRLSYEGEDYIGSSYGINDVIGRGQGARKQLFITVNAKEAVDLDLSAELVFAFEAK
jgi:hypothetical protein